MGTVLSRHTETFIVRLWVEYLGQSPPIWRGEIEHVGSKEVMHFRNLGEMSDYIQCCVLAQRHSNEHEEES